MPKHLSRNRKREVYFFLKDGGNLQNTNEPALLLHGERLQISSVSLLQYKKMAPKDAAISEEISKPYPTSTFDSHVWIIWFCDFDCFLPSLKQKEPLFSSIGSHFPFILLLFFVFFARLTHHGHE